MLARPHLKEQKTVAQADVFFMQSLLVWISVLDPLADFEILA